jgi:predicted nucleotidyltransferase
MPYIPSSIPLFPEIALAYLFGSRVEGNLGPQSDYDFAILVDREAGGPKVRSELSSALSRELQTSRVDVVLLREAPIELAFSVISEGEIIYERDVQTRVDFEARIMGLYFDYLPFLRMAREDIIKGDDHAVRARRYRQALGRTQGALGQIGAPQGKEPS